MEIREIKYLSYSSFQMFEKDPEGFYRKYLSKNRPPREPQNTYMAIGSAFDAFVKADLHKRFVNDGDPRYTPEALFETQVEPHNRDRAKVDGEELYRRYRKIGAYADLCEDMRECINPRFEAEITADISISRLPGSVVVLGKPDVMYISRYGARIIHDFKCQGFYSKNPPSPHPGYVKLMPGMNMHKDTMLFKHKGFLTNGACPIHHHNEDWATQLAFYAWSLGEDVGSDFILSVDQILSNSVKNETRVAKHAGICTDVWQNKLFDRLHRCWSAVKSGHVFLKLPYDESVARCEAIDAELGSTPDDTFRQMTSTKKREW